MTPDHVHAVMRTMSPAMHYALGRIANDDTRIPTRAVGDALTARGLITPDHTLTRLGRAVYKEHTK